MTTAKMQRRINRNEKKMNDLTSAQVVKMHIEDGDMPSMIGEMLLQSEGNKLQGLMKEFVKWLLDRNADVNMYDKIMNSKNSVHYNIVIRDLWNTFLDLYDNYYGTNVLLPRHKEIWQKYLVTSQSWFTQVTVFMLMVGESLKKKRAFDDRYDKHGNPKWHNHFDVQPMIWWLDDKKLQQILGENEFYYMA